MNTTHRRLALTALAAAALVVTAATFSSTTASADKRSGSFSARLSGYQEAPTTLSTKGSGFIRVKVDERAESLRYTLRYDDLEGAVTQAHIHFGAVALTGGISVWLCANPPITAPAGTPTCPESGTVSGTLDAADVVGPAAAGIAAGEFDELIDAIEAGTAYANVHSSLYQSGEIRGQLRRG